MGLQNLSIPLWKACHSHGWECDRRSQELDADGVVRVAQVEGQTSFSQEEVCVLEGHGFFLPECPGVAMAIKADCPTVVNEEEIIKTKQSGSKQELEWFIAPLNFSAQSGSVLFALKGFPETLGPKPLF